jgi:hypothetical protein
MSDHSIEHTLVFNTARRLLRFVAPDYRAVATELLTDNQSLLDLRKRTIEVPEGDAYKAAGMIVFSAGLLRCMASRSTVAGRVDHLGILEDQAAEKLIAMDHALADGEAYVWASQMMRLYYPELDPVEADRLTDQRQDYDAWLAYFSQK